MKTVLVSGGRTCQVCAVAFVPRRGGRPQVYCSAACRSRGYAATWAHRRYRRKESSLERKRLYDERRYRDPRQTTHRKEVVRAYHLRTKYGITPEQFDAILVAQGNRCAICKTDRPSDAGGRGWNVDHNHSDGVMRGLLCQRCNTGLAWFREDGEALKAAAYYLERRRVEL